jgi:hypothetical protein
MIVYGVTGKLLSLDEILKKKIRSREMNNAYDILKSKQASLISIEGYMRIN